MVAHFTTHFTGGFDTHALRAFEDDRRRRLLVAVRYACLAFILALAGFSLFDSFWHVGGQHGLLATRTLTLASLMLVLVVSFTPLGVRFIDQLAVVACLFFCGGTVLVVEMAGGGLSIYRDPIYILFIGFTLLIPWQPAAAAWCFATGIGFYDVLFFFSGGMGSLDAFVVSNILLGIAAVIATSGVRLINRLQRVEFGYRRRLQNLDEKLFAIDAVDQIYPNLERDLRAPLTLFMVPLDTVLQGGKLHEQQRQELDLCRRNAMRLMRMVDERLALSHLKTPPLVHDLDLISLARQLLTELQPLAARQHIAMAMQDLPTSLVIQADGAVVEQCMLAMLAYALDSGKGGDLRVSVRRRDQGAEVLIEDNGVGLSAQELAQLFAPPLQRDQEGLTPRRTALSLAAAKVRVQAQGGTLEATSELGQGTQLCLWMPRFPPAT